MRVLITGAGGMLARALVPALAQRGHEVTALARAELDVTDARAAQERVREHSPDAVIQCAAFTAVDACEVDEAEAFRVNSEGARFVAEACQNHGARLVYPSTDYVFDGEADEPYTPDEPPNPINAYGRSKRAGEVAALGVAGALVIRTSWLYGEGGKNFVDTVIRAARERGRLEVVNDQFGRPTWAGSLAVVIAELIEKGASGIFHATDVGRPTSWYTFARECVSECSIPCVVTPVASESLRSAAARPAYSVLDCSATEQRIGRRLQDWRQTLSRYLSGDGRCES